MSSSMGWISLKVPSVLTHTFLPLGMGTSLSNKRCPTPTTMSSVGGMKVAIYFFFLGVTFFLPPGLLFPAASVRLFLINLSAYSLLTPSETFEL